MVSTGWSCHIPLKCHGITGENGTHKKINGRKPRENCAVTLRSTTSTSLVKRKHDTSHFPPSLTPSHFLMFAKILTLWQPFTNNIVSKHWFFILNNRFHYVVKLPRVLVGAVGQGRNFIRFHDFLQHKAKNCFYFFYKKYDEFIAFKNTCCFMLLRHSYMQGAQFSFTMYLLHKIYITDLFIALLLLIWLPFCTISTLAPTGNFNSSLMYVVRTYVLGENCYCM